MKLLLYLLILILLKSSSLFSQYNLEPAFPNLSFLQPTDLQDPRDGTDRLFVVAQRGTIHVFTNDSSVLESKVFLDISTKIVYGGEMGLLGLAFDPNFKSNGYFYVNYTAPSTLRTVIERYKVSSTDPDKADTNSGTVILEVIQPYENHNAGQLAFGPDGYLYIGFGDGGSGGDPHNNGQNKRALLGKMLRIDVHNTSAGKNYSIPADNPFVNNSDYLPEIYSTGLRNPWRYSFDPVTGWLWCADVGQNKWEEIDIIQKGKNYGWRIVEGFHCYNPSSNCDTTGLTKPIWEYGHDDAGGMSITGGYVYRGERLPELYGSYFYADFVSGRIWGLNYDGVNDVENSLLISSGKNISTFGTDRNNELYVLAFDGKVYKIVDSDPTGVKNGKPKKFGLFYNYPNPFNPKTTIIADIKEKGHLKIDIYDVTGRHIQTLTDSSIEEGRHKFLWDAVDLPSGVYVYQMVVSGLPEGKEYKASKKMVLLK